MGITDILSVYKKIDPSRSQELKVFRGAIELYNQAFDALERDDREKSLSLLNSALEEDNLFLEAYLVSDLLRHNPNYPYLTKQSLTLSDLTYTEVKRLKRFRDLFWDKLTKEGVQDVEGSVKIYWTLKVMQAQPVPLDTLLKSE